MTAFAAQTTDFATEAAKEPTIADKIRRGRLAALTSLRAQTNGGANVVSIFENTMPLRDAQPIFHTRRNGKPARAPRLLLTNPIAA